MSKKTDTAALSETVDVQKDESTATTATATKDVKEKKYTIHLYVAIANWREGDKVVMKKKYAREKPHTPSEWEAIYQAERNRKIRN